MFRDELRDVSRRNDLVVYVAGKRLNVRMKMKEKVLV